MAGFQFNLKNKVSKTKKPSLGIKKAPKGTSILGAQEDDEPKKETIDAFDARGALQGNDTIQKELVIVPENLSTGILKKSTESEKERGKNDKPTMSESTIDDAARQSLLNGNTHTDGLTLHLSGKTHSVEENCEQDYEEVPVDQFGAALLRGMGWDGQMSKSEETDVSHRKKGVVLGIGSKSVGEELEQELTQGKLSVPLIRNVRNH